MPDSLPSTQFGSRHDRVDSPSPAARRRSDRSDVVTSRGMSFPDSRAAQFSRTASLPLRRDSPDRHKPPQRRPPSISASRGSLQSRATLPPPGGPESVAAPSRAIEDPHEPPLSHLQHLPVELRQRQVEPVALHR